MMQAAGFSKILGHPVNTVLTINAAYLQRIGEGGVFGVGHLWDGFQVLHELIRKWVTSRGVLWACIWVREWGTQAGGEHWHIALHLPKRFHADLAKQVAEWTGEAIATTPPPPSAREPAVSVERSWHIAARDGRGGPEHIAAYLGKAEPSSITRYGRRVANPDKPRRDKNGGAGRIEGKRFHICKAIGATAQAKAR